MSHRAKRTSLKGLYRRRRYAANRDEFCPRRKSFKNDFQHRGA